MKKARKSEAWVLLGFIVAVAAVVTASVLLGRARLQGAIDDIEHATGCPVVEEPMRGCAPITVPYGRTGALMYICCPER